MIINEEKCTQCGICADFCAMDAISLKNGKPGISDECTNERGCTAAEACPTEAIEREERPLAEGVALCFSCPVRCEIKPNKTGVCQRHVNQEGQLVRNTPLTTYEEVEELVGFEYDKAIRRPLLTGIGAGTTTLNTPAPFIVSDKVDGIDVITCVSECAYAFSGVKVKIDTDLHLGDEGVDVLYRGNRIGMIETEHYGFKILSIGGINTFSGKNGWLAAKVTADIANRKPVELEIKAGAHLRIQVGKKPIINEKEDQRRRIGCGGAACLIMLEPFMEVADEVIVIDKNITGHFGKPISEEPWDMETESGIRLRYGTPVVGFYFPHQGGDGWGGTPIQDPLEIIERIDPSRIKPGMTLLITETNGERWALFRFTEQGKFQEIEMTPKAKEVMERFRTMCEPARVSALYFAGAGGSARTGTVRHNRVLRLTGAIKEGSARLTVGGAPVFIYPGGGIELLVDVEKVKTGAFSWTTTPPSTISPLEYTMKLKDYEAIGGYIEAVRPLKEVLRAPQPIFVSPRREPKYSIKIQR